MKWEIRRKWELGDQVTRREKIGKQTIPLEEPGVSSPSPRPTKKSSSKLKLEGNFDYYDSKCEVFEYEIVHFDKLKEAISDIAVCKLCHPTLSMKKKPLVG